MADLDADYRIVLKYEFEERCKNRKTYSRSSFARYLKLDATYFSKLMRGKILLPLDLADQVTKILKLDHEKRARFTLSVAEEQRCHALHLIDPSLTDCEESSHQHNLAPIPRKKTSRV